MSEFEVLLMITMFCKPRSNSRATWKMYQIEEILLVHLVHKDFFIKKVTTGKE